ncbi:unnamed protein product [Effrenium voratum]|nr:unnamed protein product [Effrenium voratum]
MAVPPVGIGVQAPGVPWSALPLNLAGQAQAAQAGQAGQADGQVAHGSASAGNFGMVFGFMPNVGHFGAMQSMIIPPAMTLPQLGPNAPAASVGLTGPSGLASSQAGRFALEISQTEHAIARSTPAVKAPPGRAGVVQAAPTVSRASTAESSQVSGSLNRSQTVGSLLSAYDDEAESQDEMEPEEPQKPAERLEKPTLASRSWQNWEDMLDARRRHGIVIGKQPDDLIMAWPRDASAYPPGHPPAVPPGCCSEQCSCMDGTKRPEQWETKKPWLDDESEEAKTRAQLAQQSVEALSTQSFCTRRGRMSKQHFLEAREASSPLSEARSGLHELGKALAEALRDAIAAVSSKTLSEGLPIPVRSLLLAGGLGADYAPLRIRASSEAVRIRFDPIGTRATAGLAAGAPLQLQLVLPEGEVTLDVCRVHDAADLKNLCQAIEGALGRLRSLSLHSVRDSLTEGFSEVWDFQRGTLREAVSFPHMLSVLEKLRRRWPVLLPSRNWTCPFHPKRRLRQHSGCQVFLRLVLAACLGLCRNLRHPSVFLLAFRQAFLQDFRPDSWRFQGFQKAYMLVVPL